MKNMCGNWWRLLSCNCLDLGRRSSAGRLVSVDVLMGALTLSEGLLAGS